jgi:hypothetical protein
VQGFVEAPFQAVEISCQAPSETDFPLSAESKPEIKLQSMSHLPCSNCYSGNREIVSLDHALGAQTLTRAFAHGNVR